MRLFCRSRPALTEEQYNLHRVRSGSMGFVAGTDCETAICMPAGGRRRLEDLNEAVRRAHDFRPAEEVVMIRLPLDLTKILELDMRTESDLADVWS